MSFEGIQLGAYHILRLIGSGGMGEVYLAEDARIHRQVAIKVVRAEASPYPDANATREADRLFQREMKAIAVLDHPHILPLYEFGEQAINGVNVTYMVMPYRPEGNIIDWLQRRGNVGTLAPREVAHFVQQAAEALQHAHERQLVHQDVKPSNFLLRNRASTAPLPDLLLSDFGIAKFTTATATSSQNIRGTPAYMAPEQWDGQPVPATDQYALAIMAYQLLTGAFPFQGNPGQIMRQHFMTAPQPPSRLNPAIPPALDSVVLRALNKEPRDRYPSISEFAHAFQQAARNTVSLLAPTVPAANRGSDIQATLAISEQEARQGTSRTLTLPQGRRVTVQIPPGTNHNAVIRLESQGEPPPTGGVAGALLLTIAVKRPDAPNPPLQQGNMNTTIRPSNPNLSNPPSQPPLILPSVAQPQQRAIAPTTPVPAKNPVTPSVLPLQQRADRRDRRSSVQYPQYVPPLPQASARSHTVPVHRKSHGCRNTFVTLLILGLIASGIIGLISYQDHVNQVNAYATAASYYATATANPYGGTIDVDDSLVDNQQGNHWQTGNFSGSFCNFSSNGYHTVVSQTSSCDSNLSYQNFALQVEMVIQQNGGGGVNFRISGKNGVGVGYWFIIYKNGTYELSVNDDQLNRHDLQQRTASQDINTGNQSNVIAVRVNGDSIILYANGYQLGSIITDNTVTNGGTIGLVGAIDSNDRNDKSTEVVFSNLKVWTGI